MNSISSFRLSGTGNATERAAWSTVLTSLYDVAPPEISDAATNTLGALNTAASLGAYTPANGASYPNSSVGQALRNTAQLIKANVGLRVLTIDLGDWDMHAGLGTGRQRLDARQAHRPGQLARRLRQRPRRRRCPASPW